MDCLEAMDLEKVDLISLKRTFRFTLSWKRPKIQQLILSKISDERRPELLTSDGLHCTDPILFDLIRVDNRKIADVVLPYIIKVNPEMLLVLNGKRRSALEFSLSNDRFNIMKLIFDSIESESFLRQYIMCDYGAFKQIYQYRKMTRLVQGKIPNQDLAMALFAAVEFDDDMEFTQTLLERVSTEKEKYDLLRSLSGWNLTVFAKAAKCENRLVMEYLMNAVIDRDSDDNVFFYTEPDYKFRTALTHLADDTVNMDIFERALLSLKPEMRLQQLFWQETGVGTRWGGTIVSKSRSPNFSKKLRDLVMAELTNMKEPISAIAMSLLQCDGHQGHCEDIYILGQLFNHAMALLDLSYLELIMSKTPKDLKYELVVKYDGGWSYNRIKSVLQDSNPEKLQLMIHLLLTHFDGQQMMNALRDVDNPEHHPQTVLSMICDMGSNHKFRTIQTVYEKAKIPIEDDLLIIDHEGGSLLHRAMAKVCDIPQQIFKAMKTDKMKMKIINQRRRSDGKCLFDIARSSNKRLLKGVISGIVQNVEKSKMEYTDFIPYFQWLIKEKELNSIKVLVEVFGGKDSILQFVSAETDSKRNALHIACIYTGGSRKVIQWLLSMIKDGDLRSLLMATDNAGNCPLRYATKSCRRFVLKHVLEREQQLVRDLILHSNAFLIVDCLSSTDDLSAIFEFCGDGVLSDRSLIIQLSFGVGWESNNDPIRELIVDTVNAKVAAEPIVLPQMSQNATGHGLLSNPLLDEAGVLMKSISGNHMKYVDPFLDPNSFPIEDPETGNSSLAFCVMNDNRKLFDMIMAKLDLEINLAKHLTEYTNFRGSTLLHMAAIRTTKRNEYCDLILKNCLTQQNKQKLLYARDIDGNTIMHFVTSYASYYTKDENRKLLDLMLQSLGKKDNAQRAISLLFEYNEKNSTAMNLFVRNFSSFSDGFGLFKKLVMNPKLKATKYDIPLFARVLSITLCHIKSSSELMEIVRFTLNRFTREQQTRILKYVDKGTDYKNRLDNVAIDVDSVISRRFLMLHFLPIIADNDLCIKMDIGGLSPIHRLITKDKEAALRMLYQFDDKQIPRVLMSNDTDFATVISRGGSDMISQFMDRMDVNDLLKLFLETDDNRLFVHFQEICGKSKEMMTKLLLCQSPLDARAHDGTTFSMKLLQSENVTEFRWITFHIARLGQKQIVAVLNQADNMGNHSLLKIGKETLSGMAFKKWKELLSLCPDDRMKRDYITRQNYRGECAFDNASTRICTMKTVDGQILFGDDWMAGYRLQRAAKLCLESRQWWVWTKRYLRTMKSEFVDSVEWLVPVFYAAASNYDLVFAELILRKVNTANKANVTTFLTTRAMEEQATVFHFAAGNMKTGIWWRSRRDDFESSNIYCL